MSALALGLALLAVRPAGGDTLRLEELQAAAEAHDPRARQLSLQERATGLRLEGLAAQRLPQLSLQAEGSHLSDVTRVPIELPGVSVPTPPRDRAQATLSAQELLYDGGRNAGRRAVEEARLGEARAAVRASIYALREEVDAAFFAAFLAQARRAEVASLESDLEARLTQVRERVRAGAALKGDAAAVEAELLRARQQGAEAAAGRRAALAVLSELTGREIRDDEVLALPDLAAAVERARAAAPGGLRARPEYARFDSTRARLAREARLAATERRPRVVAFGQAGYGRPGLNQFSDRFDDYWIAGVRVEWTPWDWGTSRREREALRLQGEVVATEEAAFAARLSRAVQDQLAAMDRLEAALATDDTIAALRQEIEREARHQLDERVITAAEYVSRRNDVLEARLARERHRVELAQARSRYLTTLGLEGER